MLSANFKPKTTAAASRGFLASCGTTVFVIRFFKGFSTTDCECDLQNTCDPPKNCGSFVDAESSERQQIRPTLLHPYITFSLTSKHVTLNGHFAFNSVIRRYFGAGHWSGTERSGPKSQMSCERESDFSRFRR